MQHIWLLMLIICAVDGWSVTLRITTPHQDGSNYFAFPGSNLTLICEHQGLSEQDREYIEISRNSVMNGRDWVYSFSSPSYSRVEGSLMDRATAEVSSAGVSLTITQFNVDNDAVMYDCYIYDNMFDIQTTKISLVQYVLVPPTVSYIYIMSPLSVTEYRSTNIVCKTSFSNRPNAASLSFSLKVNGLDRTKTGYQSPGSGNVSTVIYTFTNVRLARGDTSLECEMTWEKDKPGVMQTHTSAAAALNIYFDSTESTMIKPDDLVIEGDTLKLSCFTESNPTVATFKWTMDGTAISTGITNRQVTNGTQYNGIQRISELSMVVHRFHNKVMYACYVESRPYLRKQYLLSIKFPPKSSSLRLSPVGHIIMGDTVTVTCTIGESYDNATTTLKWLLNDLTMNGSQSSITGIYHGQIISSVLNFKVKKSQIKEKVSCVPIWDGEEQVEITKYQTFPVYCPTIAPKTIRVSQVTPFSATVYWTPGVIGCYEQVHQVQYREHNIKFFTDAALLQNSTKSMQFSLTTLFPKTHYVCRIRVKNYYNGSSYNYSEEYHFKTPAEGGSLGASDIVLASGTTIGIVMLLIFVIVMACMAVKGFFKKSKQHDSEQNQEFSDHIYCNSGLDVTSSFDDDGAYELVDRRLEPEPALYTELMAEKVKQQVTNIKLVDLVVKDLIYSGNFSVLKLATLIKGKENQEVVIKLPKDGLESDNISVWTYQIKALKILQKHPNVIEVLSFNGNLDTEDLMLVTKYYPHRDLKSYLQSQGQADYCNLEQNIFHKFSVDVAKGMEFLQQQKEDILCHELSANHVMVDSYLTCKLAGFGLSHDVILKQEQEIENGFEYNVQWKSPECLTDPAMHTKYSDVWSYGVLMYEIYTAGSQPYDGMLDTDVVSFVQQGNTLDCPHKCPQDIYDLMKLCWTYSSEDRPLFTDILTTLNGQKENGNTDAVIYEAVC